MAIESAQPGDKVWVFDNDQPLAEFTITEITERACEDGWRFRDFPAAYTEPTSTPWPLFLFRCHWTREEAIEARKQDLAEQISQHQGDASYRQRQLDELNAG